MASLNKDRTQETDWQELDDTASDAPSSESSVIDSPTQLEKHLIVTMAHKDGNDAASAYVTLDLMIKTGAADEDWKKWSSQQAGGGVAVTEALDAESASGQKQIKVGATTDWDTGLLERLLLYNVGTPINSEVVTIGGWSDADYYLAIEDLTNTHDAGDGDALYSGVDEVPITIPASAIEAKIIAGNSDGDATYLWRVDSIQIDSIK